MRVQRVAQHLERRTKFGRYTGGEWLRVGISATLALAWWRWVSPLGFQTTICVAVLIVAPALAEAELRDIHDLGLGHVVRARARFMRRAHRYALDAGENGPRGYLLVDADSPAAPQQTLTARTRARLGRGGS